MEKLEQRNIGIDVLKALSVISVIIYHLYEYKGSYIGVIIFFVISGYFITSILIEREESYFSFILKRFSKIYPLLITVLAIVCLIFFIFNGFLTKKMIYSSISAFLGISNIYQIQSGLSYFERGDMYPLLHTWTLSIEIQFYIFYPILIYILKKLKISDKKNCVVLLVLSLVSALVMCIKANKNYDINALYYGTDTRIFSLLIGGAYYFIFKGREIKKRKINILASISLVIIFLSILYTHYLMDINYKGYFYFLSILSGIVVIAVIKADFLNYNNKFFKIIGGIGKRSYCYYLWQYPIMIFSEEYFKWSDIKYIYTVVIQMIILIIVSEISYIYLEERVKMARMLQRIFLIIYLVALFFLPISEETNSKIIEERINEVDIEMQIKKINSEIEEKESTDNFEERLLETEKVIQENDEKNVVDEQKNIVKEEKQEPQKNEEIKMQENNTEITKEEETKKVEEATEDKLLDEEKYTFIGDSVMKGAEPFIKDIFVNANIDAKVSRQFTNLPEILKDLEKNESLSSKVVIHLGTNGVMNKESFEKSMELLKEKEVYFINAVVPKFWEESINENLVEWSKDYENVKIIDWYKKAKGKKEMFYKDAVHPNKDGAKIYAEFIYENIKSN